MTLEGFQVKRGLIRKHPAEQLGISADLFEEWELHPNDVEQGHQRIIFHVYLVFINAFLEGKTYRINL